MPYYENVFVARQDVTQNQVENLTQNFVSAIEQNAGKVAKKEYWGVRTLAYPIKKNKKGHYTLLGLEAPASAIKELERLMGLNEDVIRFLTVKVESIDPEPSVIMSQKSGRGYDDDFDDAPGGTFGRSRPRRSTSSYAETNGNGDAQQETTPSVTE